MLGQDVTENKRARRTYLNTGQSSATIPADMAMYRFTPTSWAAGTATADVEHATSLRRKVPPRMTLTTASHPMIQHQTSSSEGASQVGQIYGFDFEIHALMANRHFIIYLREDTLGTKSVHRYEKLLITY
jgi:hypothetical protein